MYGRKEFGIAMIVGAAALLSAAPQAAAQTGHTPHRYSQQAIQHALRYVDELEVQGQRMMTEVMQVALDIEPALSLERFQTSHAFFEEVLHTLQNGDPERDIPVPANADLIAPLDALQQVWTQLDFTFSKVLDTGNVTRTDVIILSELDNVLVDVARQVEEAYAHEFARNNLSSIAVITVVEAERQSLLIERMQTELLLTFYGHDTDMQRTQMAETAAHFEATLTGLISGDPANRLMPPPTTEIKTSLREVQRHWDAIAPTLERVAQGESIDRSHLIEVVHLMEPLYEEMEHAVDLY